MYFVYQKQINVASEYSYDVDSIVEWFKDYINLNDIIEELIKEASPYDYSNRDIDAEDITELVTEDEFLEKFKEWYLSD